MRVCSRRRLHGYGFVAFLFITSAAFFLLIKYEMKINSDCVASGTCRVPNRALLVSKNIRGVYEGAEIKRLGFSKNGGNKKETKINKSEIQYSARENNVWKNDNITVAMGDIKQKHSIELNEAEMEQIASPETAQKVFQKEHFETSTVSRKVVGDISKTKKGSLHGRKLAEQYHYNITRPRTMFDCGKLVKGDSREQNKFSQWEDSLRDETGSRKKYTTVPETIVPEMMSDCAAFKKIRGYSDSTGTELEKSFPLAHVVLVHKDFEHMERLVRSLYMPQHVFCIHVDAKTHDSLKKAVFAYANCFSNIYVASKPQNIVYAHMTRLLADIVCMKDMVELDKPWRYLINYAATELPLRTNQELVQVLNAMHGLNDIRENFRGRIAERYTKEYTVVRGVIKPTDIELPPAPHNLTIVKGLAYNTYTREFMEWVFSDEKPRDFLNWSNKTFSPDEHYWATLNDLYHNGHLKTPGGFPHMPDKKGFITKFILWTHNKTCHGLAVHNICNFNALDLPSVVRQPQLAANKFDLMVDPVGYSCMEELLENRTATPDPAFNIKKYESLYFIRSTRGN